MNTYLRMTTRMTMTSIILSLILFAFSSKQVAAVTFRGDTCTLESGAPGTCADLEECPSAIALLRENKTPSKCGFEKSIPIVCCSDYKKPQKLTVPPENIPVKKVDPKDITKQACQRYNRKPLFTLGAYGGEKSLAGEFPHMAILGYIDKNGDTHWLCGGSLISLDFVLTAAHCIFSKDLGKVKRVRLGDLDISNTADDASPQDFNVSETFVHPDYRLSAQYHDIALIKLDRYARYDSDYVIPACLHFDHDIDQNNLQATGWGKTDFAGEPSTHLMKVGLSYINNAECSKYYKNVSKRKLQRGIDDISQMCAGDSGGRDTCPGDSGGPLQFHVDSNPTQYKHWRIVGVTSFGKACGIEKDSCGVYTRVSHYVPWIVGIVWPNGVSNYLR